MFGEKYAVAPDPAMPPASARPAEMSILPVVESRYASADTGISSKVINITKISRD
jgi:hypothetical protein